MSFFFIKKEPFALTQAVVPAETLKACAQIGLHLMAESASMSSGSQSLFLGDHGGEAAGKALPGTAALESWTEKRRHFFI